ncbi:MAG: DNA-directed RNA polymerase subunit B [Candidatus Woesearchaeota archaeon]
MTEIYLDSKYIGNVKDSKEFLEQLITTRRMGKIHYSVNFLFRPETDQIFMENSRGRVVRPVIVVKDGKPLLTEKHLQQLEKNELSWSDLIKQGIIEYLDCSEEENSYIAFREEELTNEHTHLEISQSDMLGLCTSIVPFGNYNHGVRLMQGSKNQKHAIGIYSTNYYCRMDMDVNILHYPQTPIVSTLMYDLAEMEKHPAGQNVIVAIMSYDGYNMEDAIILNKGSIDRGLARSTYYRPVASEELRYAGGLTDKICIPNKDVKGYRTEKDYRFLEGDGIIYPEAEVSEGDVVIGKIGPPRFLSSLEEYNLTTSAGRESSVAMKHGEKGIVDFIVITENSEGNKLVQVRVRDQRIPEIGDKFTSRHGQKGVIGLIIPEADVPFTSNGVKPDIIFSPHGIPTRMTVAHLLELLGGKVGALSGRKIDGTIFESEKEEDLRKQLLDLGFREDGSEVMYSGITGRKYKSTIFIGDMYYLKLKHLVQNKIHSRARGPIQLLTRQPTEGRAKEGGLRLGEMEKDTFIAHGASLLLKERFDSDRTIVPVCEKCGLIAVKDTRKNIMFCPLCGENVNIENVEMSYAFKLMLDELKSMCIYPKLILKGKY